MMPVTDSKPAEAAVEPDLVAEIQRILRASDEPLTLSKIRAHLPARFRSTPPEELTELLQRQVAANVLVQYPRYRSQQDRFWDRPMPVHVAVLLGASLQGGPLPWSELRRKLPAYAQGQAEAVLEEQVAQGKLFRHPRTGRGGDRFGVLPPDPKDYLRQELVTVFRRLEQMGFTQAQLREAALDLLHEEEWSSAPAAQTPPGPAPEAQGQPEPSPAAPPVPAATAPPAEAREPAAPAEHPDGSPASL